jgi:hypothetical protein
MGARVGLEAKAYRNTGTYAAPAWDELRFVRDVNIPLKKGQADLSARGVKWRLKKGTMIDLDLTFDAVYDASDADFTALRDAFLEGTDIDLAFFEADIATNGNQGLRGMFQVTQFGKTEKLEEGQHIEIVVSPAYTLTQYPKWYVVSGGALVESPSGQ